MSHESKKILDELNRDKCDDCNCVTSNAFDQVAAQFAHRASNVNAVAMEQFQLQVAAQNAMLLKMQSSIYFPDSTGE